MGARQDAAEDRSTGIRLFELFGIEIRLDVSVALIFALIVFSLGTGVFPDWHPEWTAATAWTTALAAGVLFFVSLLAHELSHSLMARRYEIRVPRITLFLFGGVAEIEREAETPGAEFAIAIAGPIMSLLIGFACLWLAAALVGGEVLERVVANPDEGMAEVSATGTALIWLGSVNFMLAIFNMVPGFPLDGGRVFRALIWRFTGDYVLATRLAAQAGKLFGWAIMGLGFWNLFVWHALGGLWFVLIGWFLSHLATASYAQVQTQRLLGPLTVADVMRTRFETVPSSLMVSEFIEDYMLRSSQLLWPVVSGAETLGTVSFNQVAKLAPDARDTTQLADIAQPLAGDRVLDPETMAMEAAQRFTRPDDQPLAVVRGGEVVGLLRGSDVLKYMMLHEADDPAGTRAL